MPDAETASLPPIVVDLGKVGRKRIRRLKEGRGPLMGEVDQVVEAVRNELGAEAEDQKILPVVVVYRRKRKKRKLWNW